MQILVTATISPRPALLQDTALKAAGCDKSTPETRTTACHAASWLKLAGSPMLVGGDAILSCALILLYLGAMERLEQIEQSRFAHDELSS